MWPTSAPPPRYGLPPELGMFVVAPATPFHNHNHNHQDPNNNNHNNSLLSSDPNHQINVGVIPLLTSSLDDSPDLLPSRPRGAPIQFWNQHHQQQQNQPYYNKTGSISFDQNAVTLLNSGGGDGGGGAGAVVSGGATATCQDCGNQAKKDCSHRRCRTCCRSRGFDCTTHVRSTWVPAARRRERQMMGVAAGGGCGGGGGGASSGSTSGAKKPRLIASQNTATTSHTSNSNTPPRSFDTSSSHQDVGFKESLPRQVRAPAVFKCVRVTAVDDGDDEYAYQAVVRIGGHLFKGFLYDQGAEAGDGFPNISELHLGGGRNGVSSSSPILDQPEAYGGSGGGVLGGSGYGNTIN